MANLLFQRWFVLDQNVTKYKKIVGTEDLLQQIQEEQDYPWS